MLQTNFFTEAGFSRAKIAAWVDANYPKDPMYMQEAQQGIVLHFLITRGFYEHNGNTITAEDAKVAA